LLPSSEAISTAFVVALNYTDSVVLPNDITGYEDLYNCELLLPDERWLGGTLFNGGDACF
jgi:hypothetical protein